MPEQGRVLVIEDDSAVGRVVADALADEGYEVRWARNGREGLAALAGWLPDLIVLDLMMPVMDGWAFHAAQQRLAGEAARVPVLVLSGARELAAKAAALDAVATITKPFDLEEIVQMVARVIGRRGRAE